MFINPIFNEVSMPLYAVIIIILVTAAAFWFAGESFLQNKYGMKPGQVHEIQMQYQAAESERTRLQERNGISAE